jgi:hypothetical protein
MKFIATLILVQHSRAEISIHARTLEEAQEKAAARAPEKVIGWIPFEGQVSVQSVQSVRAAADAQERRRREPQ